MMKRRDAVLALLFFTLSVFGFGIYKYFGPEIKPKKSEIFLGSIGGDGNNQVNAGGDKYPWVNTILYDILKGSGTYSSADANFVADHFDLAVGRLQDINGQIKQRNSAIKTLFFNGLGYLSASGQAELGQFFSANPNYSLSEKESVYLHYKCDTFVHYETIKGCNLKNSQTGECFATPAAGCAASSATQLSQARAPDADPNFHRQGWVLPNYKSAAYKDFGVWELKQNLNYYSQPADGTWWDNFLYISSVGIDKTIEYWGKPDLPPSQEHERDRDYHNYFLAVKSATEQDPSVNRSLLWLGNIGSMYFIRSGGPFISWLISNMSYFGAESWVNPRGAGEYQMPSWSVDCPEVKDAWTYTNQDGKNLPVFSYNYTNVYGSDLKTRIFSLAKYYLVKNSNLYYGYREDSGGANLNNEWNPMAGFNIGDPKVNPAGVLDFEGQSGTDKFFNWKSPGASVSCSVGGANEIVLARHFTNGLVLARWKPNRWSGGGAPPAGAEYNSDNDPKVYQLVNLYGASYYVLQTDGTLSSAPVTEITLRTNEAAVLVSACGEGAVPNGASCSCGGNILGSGQWCCGGQQKSVCSNDSQCAIQGGLGQVCNNPNTCQAQCGAASPPPPPPPPPANSFNLSVSKTGSSNGTITSNPAGINCGADCGESYSSGSQITLSASPDNNSRFDGWSGACNGAGTCVLTMDGDKSVSAIFNSFETTPPPPPPTPPPPPQGGTGNSPGNQVSPPTNPVAPPSVSPLPPNQIPPKPVIDLKKVSETISNIGKSFGNVLYFLKAVAVLILLIALFY